MRAMVLAVVGALLAVGQVEAGGFGAEYWRYVRRERISAKGLRSRPGRLENPRNVPGWLEQVHLKYEMDRP